MILKGMDRMDIGVSNKGGEGAKVGSNVRIFQFLDGCHVNVVVCANGGTTMGKSAHRRWQCCINVGNEIERIYKPPIEAIKTMELR